MHALSIEGRNNVNSPRTTKSFENNAIESMSHAITSFQSPALRCLEIARRRWTMAPRCPILFWLTVATANVRNC
jgi:hypothetical protein